MLSEAKHLLSLSGMLAGEASATIPVFGGRFLYSRSHLVKAGLFFIVPEIVYRKFEEVLGHDLPQAQAQAADSISVHTYQLGPPVEAGRMREVQVVRKLRFRLEDFAQRFISGSHLPPPEELDGAVLKALGMSGANKRS